MTEAEQKVEGIIEALPILNDFGAMDKHAVKVLTTELNELKVLIKELKK